MAYDVMRGRQDGRDWSCGIEEVGGFFTPRSILNKIDDVRYDVRQAGSNISGGIYALAGAAAALAFAKVYKYAKDRRVA